MYYNTLESEMQVHIFLKTLDKSSIVVYNMRINNAYFEILKFRYTHYWCINVI